MRPPDNTQLYETEIGTYWFDADGILCSLSKSPRRTMANTTANFAFIRRITDNKKVPLLTYLTNSPVPDKQTRKLVAKELPNVYSAMAMVSKPGLSKLIMNVLFSLKPPAIPMKSFSDDQEARQWLKQYL
jgi:hypothetical protein